ncbi:hypothetical protein [Lichenibacterium minor]|uniref:hypothetical protein n=1 Tax=Lichenibacterium minor TaxID=2316528 RepID=UPI0013ECA492|nr:hypothetical protein [Lichenibacterium minor]
MMGFAGSSYALFAAVWSVLCLLSGVVVTDSMLRGVPSPSAIDADRPGDSAA